MSSCVIFVANRGYALTSSRTAIIQRFLSSGWKVVIATADDSESQKLCELGVLLEPLSFKRGGFSLKAEVSVYQRLKAIYSKWKPDLIHHFHAKPVILGSIAAHKMLGHSVQVVNTITGLGHAFLKGGLSARLAGFGYKLALPNTAITIFQNSDDQSLFLDYGWVQKKKAKLIASSGVDLKKYFLVDRRGRNSHSLTVVMLGRLLKQKGIPEFVTVAQRLHKKYPDIRFLLAGEVELEHPDAVKVDWICNQSDIEYLGRLSDVTDVLNRADLFLFPSYYREGVPRVVLEAAAMGVPAIGFDVPGVREAVQSGKTGYLVPSRDVDSLTEKVIILLENEDLRLSMGLSARELMERDFDKKNIDERYMQVYQSLGLEVN